ncbi:MAG: hypothetical protein QOH88_481 [Verrucomicrobiota bacterium]|jgi:hypothetical protein
MITATQFSELLISEFPQLAEEVAEDAGLFHLHMAAFARLTQAAIDAGRLDAVREHFIFADRAFHDAMPDLKNAFYVSYLEHLDFTGRHGKDAQSLLSPPLRQGWREITDYMAQLARIQPKQSHGTQNA